MKGPICSCGDITRSRIVERWPVWECLSCGRVEWLATRLEAMLSPCVECGGRVLLHTRRLDGYQWFTCTCCGLTDYGTPDNPLPIPGRVASSA